MKKFLPLLVSTSLTLCSTTSMRAALDPAIVPADARWVIHLDLNTLRQSVLGREVLDLAAKKDLFHANNGFRIDFEKLLTTVGQATAFGSNFQSAPKDLDGTIVIEGTPELRKIAEGFIAQSEISQPDRFVEIKGLNFEAYSMNGDMFIGFPKEPIILVSKMKSQLQHAYDVYRRKSPSLAKESDAPLRKLLPSDTDAFVSAASVLPSDEVLGGGGPQARLLKMADAGSVVFGEKNRMAYAHFKLIAKSEDMADKLAKILQGLTAMASLAETNDRYLDQFLRSATVEHNELGVDLNLSYSSERLAEMIKSTLQDGGATPPKPPVPVSHPIEEHGKVIAEWTAEQDLGSGEPEPQTWVTRKIENVPLSGGSIISILGKADGGEHARVDYVEIQSTDHSSPPLKFEAEFMKLRGGYLIEKLPAASGGKVIRTDSQHAVAELQFPGAPGLYTVNVRYADENDGKSTFTVLVQDPADDKN